MKNKVVILTIGDELLLGQTIDTNSAWMGMELSKIGYEVIEKMAVKDTPADMIDALKRACMRAPVVIVTGGLGPTNDDRTLEVLSTFLQRKLTFHEASYNRIAGFFEKRNIPLTAGHRKECMLPEGSIVLENRVGTAPGTKHVFNENIIYSMPGVPAEMQAIMEDFVLPDLAERNGTHHILHKTFRTIGVPESTLAERLKRIEEALPPFISMAYLPSLGEVKVRISGEGTDLPLLESTMTELKEKLDIVLGADRYGYDEENIEAVIGKRLQSEGLMLGLAESCTGGNISAGIVANPGSSAYYKGSIISYSNAVKEKVLGVDPETIEQEGAVSKSTVEEMVRGTLKVLEVDVAVAVSGVAGPTGGTPEKPVGTIWIAVGDSYNLRTKLFKGGADRQANIERAGVYAMRMLWRFLQERKSS